MNSSAQFKKKKNVSPSLSTLCPLFIAVAVFLAPFRRSHYAAHMHRPRVLLLLLLRNNGCRVASARTCRKALPPSLSSLPRYASSLSLSCQLLSGSSSNRRARAQPFVKSLATALFVLSRLRESIFIFFAWKVKFSGCVFSAR